MTFENSKKSLLTLKLVSCIIINFLKLKEIYSNSNSNNLLGKINFIRDLSSFSLDLLSFNVVSMLVNIIPFYKKVSSVYKFVIEKVKKN